MRRLRSDDEVEELVDAARHYCESLAAYRLALAEGRLSNTQEAQATRNLALLEEHLRLLNSNSDLDRRQARAATRHHPILFMDSRTSGRRAHA